MDWEFFLRLSRHVAFAAIDEILVDAPIRPDSLSRNDRLFVASFRRLLECCREYFLPRPELQARHLGTMADRLCMMGDWMDGRAQYARACCLNPRHAGHAAGWLLAHCPPLYRMARHARRMRIP